MPVLKFVIIPTKDTYEEYSAEIISRIKDVHNCSAEMDKNYNELMNLRINKHKKNNKNIIAIGLSEVEHDTIMIHFNGVRPKTMETDEFIALLESYDEEEEDGDDSDSSSSESSQDEDVKSMFQKSKTLKQKNNNKKEKNEEEGEEEDNCIIC